MKSGRFTPVNGHYRALNKAEIPLIVLFIFSGPALVEKIAMIEPNHSRLSIVRQRELLNLSRATY